MPALERFYTLMMDKRKAKKQQPIRIAIIGLFALQAPTCSYHSSYLLLTHSIKRIEMSKSYDKSILQHVGAYDANKPHVTFDSRT